MINLDYQPQEGMLSGSQAGVCVWQQPHYTWGRDPTCTSPLHIAVSWEESCMVPPRLPQSLNLKKNKQVHCIAEQHH